MFYIRQILPGLLPRTPCLERGRHVGSSIDSRSPRAQPSGCSPVVLIASPANQNTVTSSFFRPMQNGESKTGSPFVAGWAGFQLGGLL